ncbi:hypothetical protein EDC04DRAFT_2614269 [Pisolithus marmoratus]|nr:hypothetical protein EDC04DRAFT_2614269 [Pisolithus marmoratus]
MIPIPNRKLELSSSQCKLVPMGNMGMGETEQESSALLQQVTLFMTQTPTMDLTSSWQFLQTTVEVVTGANNSNIRVSPVVGFLLEKFFFVIAWVIVKLQELTNEHYAFRHTVLDLHCIHHVAEFEHQIQHYLYDILNGMNDHLPLVTHETACTALTDWINATMASVLLLERQQDSIMWKEIYQHEKDRTLGIELNDRSIQKSEVDSGGCNHDDQQEVQRARYSGKDTNRQLTISTKSYFSKFILFTALTPSTTTSIAHPSTCKNLLFSLQLMASLSMGSTHGGTAHLGTNVDLLTCNFCPPPDEDDAVPEVPDESSQMLGFMGMG